MRGFLYGGSGVDLRVNVGRGTSESENGRHVRSAPGRGYQPTPFSRDGAAGRSDAQRTNIFIKLAKYYPIGQGSRKSATERIRLRKRLERVDIGKIDMPEESVR
ncbi:hypothetical protein Bbelb_327420 [Branchiostoma belcheri]|nr:hypothetical protein Bbelb_327420 [Branchiostoma belcheri]